jgi:hypothetical protein
MAASVCVAAQSLGPLARYQTYQRVAERIAYYQRRNQQARRSHTKTTLSSLKTLGIRLSQIPSCIPPDW